MSKAGGAAAGAKSEGVLHKSVGYVVRNGFGHAGGSSGGGVPRAAKALPTRERLLEGTTNLKLRNTIEQLYRVNAKIGDGGLADAVRHELTTGELVGGKSHLQKANERIKNIENIIRTQNLNEHDKDIALRLLDDLKKCSGRKIN